MSFLFQARTVRNINIETVGVYFVGYLISMFMILAIGNDTED